MISCISSLLQRCTTLKSLKSIHANILVFGCIFSSDIVINKLLRTYFRFGALCEARHLFDEIPHTENAFLWTSLIHGHVQNCLYHEALLLFRLMLTAQVAPLNFTLSSVLKALSRESRLQDGESIHGLIFKSGFDSDLTVQNSVLDLYSRCGELGTARRVFDANCLKDVVSWNCMISGYSSHGRCEEAKGLFDRMPERTVVSWTAMICGYAKVGNMAAAQELFHRMPSHDPASVNVMISGFIDIGDVVNAHTIFEKMPEKDIGSWNLMISGLCKAGDVNSGRDLFDRMPQKKVVSWTMMVNGYIGIGDLESARCLFDEMPEKNLVSWSTMIAGYAKHGQPSEALKLFKLFKVTGIKPDTTFISVIVSACAQLGVLDTAEAVVHEYIGQAQLSDVKLVASLIDMYAKCGAVDKAFQVFEDAYEKDLVCYSTMISAYAGHGYGHEAIALFDKMVTENIKPDTVAFIGVLTACSHVGLVNEGRRLFKMMIECFGVKPSEAHYACMVDLLGRAGYLEEAHEMIKAMDTKPHSGVWGALLAACRVHCNVELAEVAARNLFEIEPDNSGNFILLSNIYAAAKRWGDVAIVRGAIRENKVIKKRGSSWIELGCVVHEFVMGDVSHKDSDSILTLLDYLVQHMNEYSIEPLLTIQ